MAFESSGTILYVAKISYQSHNWYGNCQGGTKTVHRHTHTQTHTPTTTRKHKHIQTHTHTQKQTHKKTHTQTHTHTQKHTQIHTNAHTDTHIHIDAYLICLIFLRNKQKQDYKVFSLNIIRECDLFRFSTDCFISSTREGKQSVKPTII